MLKSALVHTTRGRINKDGLCKLRLVSRNLNALVSPVLFAKVNLAFFDAHKETAPDCMRCREITIALATHSTQAFENTKRLFFCTQKMYWASEGERREVFETRNIVVQKIFDAIAALKNLQIVQQVSSPVYGALLIDSANSLLSDTSTTRNTTQNNLQTSSSVL